MATNVCETVASPFLGELISAAYAHLIDEARRSAIKCAREYQHRPEGFETVAFAAVYSEDRAVAQEARSQIYWNPAAMPEMELAHFTFERAIQFNEVDLSQPGVHCLNGLVIFRYRGDGGGARKVRVAIVYGIASNGNNYQRKAEILEDKFERASVEDSLEKLYLEVPPRAQIG